MTISSKGGGASQYAIWTNNAANNYSGNTTIFNADGLRDITVKLGVDNALPMATAVTINNATLDAATFTNTLGTLSIMNTATINLGAGAQLAFADSQVVDWSSGALRLTGNFVPGSSLRFATSSGLTSAQLSTITAPAYSHFALNASGYLTAQPIATAVSFQ